MNLINKILFEIRKDKEFFFFIFFSFGAILVGLNYTFIFNYLILILYDNISEKRLDIIIGLLTTQLPLCIFVLGKNDGKLKYNFIKSYFLRKTKIIYIVVALLFLLIFTIFSSENNYISLFLFLIAVVLIVYYTIIVYMNILRDIMCIDDETFIYEMFDKISDRINRKIIHSNEIDEMISFCSDTNNIKYCVAIYNKIIEKNSDFSRQFIYSILNHFEIRYKNIMNYAQENKLNISFEYNNEIKKSAEMIELLNGLRMISITKKKEYELSFIIDFTVSYLINVLKYYYDNNANNEYCNEIDELEHYFEASTINPLIFDRFYDIFLFGISKYIYSAFTTFDNYQVCENFVNIINCVSKNSIINKNIENLYAILFFYLSQIEFIICLKKISLENKKTLISDVVMHIKTIIEFDDFVLYLSFLSNAYNQNIANKFSVLFDNGLVEDTYNINIYDLMYCCFSWVYSKSGIKIIDNNAKDADNYKIIFDFFKQTKDDDKKLHNLIMLNLIDDYGIKLLSNCINDIVQ